MLYILCGVGFSGKSTIAKQIAERTGALLISQDALFFEKQEELRLDIDSDEDWEKISALSRELIKDTLSKGISVVFDHTNLTRKERNDLHMLAKTFNIQSITIYMDTPRSVQESRIQLNKETKERHTVKEEYLEEARKELEIPTTEERVVFIQPNNTIEEILENIKTSS